MKAGCDRILPWNRESVKAFVRLPIDIGIPSFASMRAAVQHSDKQGCGTGAHITSSHEQSPS